MGDRSGPPHAAVVRLLCQPDSAGPTRGPVARKARTFLLVISLSTSLHLRWRGDGYRLRGRDRGLSKSAEKLLGLDGSRFGGAMNQIPFADSNRCLPNGAKLYHEIPRPARSSGRIGRISSCKKSGVVQMRTNHQWHCCPLVNYAHAT